MEMNRRNVKALLEYLDGNGLILEDDKLINQALKDYGVR